MRKAYLSIDPIVNYRMLAFSPSWLCEGRCLHCFIPESFRRKDDYDPQVIQALIDKLPAEIRVICLTGGEPFLRPKRMLQILEKISNSSRRSTVVTNGNWAKDWRQTERILNKAFLFGLRAISVSLDGYHRPRITLARAMRLLDLARGLGMAINVRGTGKEARQKFALLKSKGFKLGPDDSNNLYNLDNVGAAEEIPPDTIQRPSLDFCSYVREPMVMPDGRVMACHNTRLFQIDNPLLFRGNIKHTPLNQILAQSSRDYRLAALLTLGPAGVLRLISKPIPARSQIGSCCQLCVESFNNSEILDELNLRISTNSELRKEITGRVMMYDRCYRPEFLPQMLV